MAVRTLDPQEKAQLLQRINSGLDARGVDRGKPRLVAEVDRAMIDVDNRRFTYSFSSETPVERWWGTEILSHDPKDVDLSRFAAKAMAPLLVDHDWRIERQVGVIEEASIDEQRRKGYATARMSKKAFAEEQWLEIQDGQIGNISVGYDVLDILLVEEKKGAPPTYRCKWAPYETSLVPVAADIKVGAGRGFQSPTAPVIPNKEDRMDPENPTQTGAAAGTATPPAPQPAASPAPDIRGTTPSDDKGPQQRAEIMAVALQINRPDVWEIARHFVTNGGTPDEFRVAAFRKVHGESSIVPVTDSPDLGLGRNDLRRFNLMRVMRAVAFPEDRTMQQEAAFETDVCQSFLRKNRRTSQIGGMVIPGEILRRPMPMRFTGRAQDLMAGTASYGGETVQKDIMGDQFIELLRNSAVTMAMGRVISGLTGNVSFPSQSSGATGYWVTENNAVTDSTVAFGALALSPKTVGGYMDISRQLLLQSSIDVEALVMDDLTKVIGNAIDAVAIGPITGSAGSGEPAGFLTLPSGIGNEAWAGTDGCNPTWALMVHFETTVAAGNAGGKWMWLMNPKTRGYLKQIMKVATYGDTPVWDSKDPQGPVNSYPVVITNNVPSTITKASSGATLSAIIFGNFDDLLFGLWDGLEIARDTAAGFLAGTVRIRALQSLDLGLRHAASFAVSDEVKTV